MTRADGAALPRAQLPLRPAPRRRARGGGAGRRGAGRRVAPDHRPRSARHRRLGADRRHRRPQGARRGGDRQRHPGHLRPGAQHHLPRLRHRAGRGDAAPRRSCVGVNVLDSSGYPDCRPEWLAAMQEVARLGTKAGVERRPVTIRAPLIQMSKAEIIRAGVALGVDYGLTHSCYDPDAVRRRLRRLRRLPAAPPGFEAAGVPDPTRYAWTLSGPPDGCAARALSRRSLLQGPPKAPVPQESAGRQLRGRRRLRAAAGSASRSVPRAAARGRRCGRAPRSAAGSGGARGGADRRGGASSRRRRHGRGLRRGAPSPRPPRAAARGAGRRRRSSGSSSGRPASSSASVESLRSPAGAPSAMIGRPASVGVGRLGVGDDLRTGAAPRRRTRARQARALPARVLRGEDVAEREQDLARQLAVAARRAQPLERRRDRLRDQLADVAHAGAVGIERVAQRRQHQHRQQQRVRGRHRAPRRRAVERGQVAPEARAAQRRLGVAVRRRALRPRAISGARISSSSVSSSSSIERLAAPRAQQAVELLRDARLRALRDLRRCSIMRR